MIKLSKHSIRAQIYYACDERGNKSNQQRVGPSEAFLLAGVRQAMWDFRRPERQCAWQQAS
jgi:hypothetical protein